MAVRTLTKAEAEMLGLPVGVPLRAPVVGYRIAKDEMLLYLQLADGSEAEAIDLVPLLAWMERVQRGEG